MSRTRYLNDRLSPETWHATAVPKHYPSHVNYWLMRQGESHVDAKRIWPLMWLYLLWFLAIGCFYITYLIEGFSYYFSARLYEETRIEFIQRTVTRFIEIEYYGHFLGLLFASLLLLTGLQLILARYPTPLRFNKNNGLVYTQRWGKLWITPWNKAHIRLWRFANIYSAGRITERALAVRLFRVNRQGKLIECWEPIAGTDNLDVYAENLGGCPTVLYWHWLNDYMQGKELPAPKTGRQSLFEHLRFRNYRFPKDIDAQAEKLHQQLQQQNLYPDENVDNASLARVPDDPFFPWEHDFPGVPKPVDKRQGNSKPDTNNKT